MKGEQRKGGKKTAPQGKGTFKDTSKGRNLGLAHRKPMRQNIPWKGIKPSTEGSRTKWGLGSTVDPKN